MKESDDFDVTSQINARARGDYDRIAREAEASGKCVFCDLKDKYIITEYRGMVLTVNLFPRSTGDLMVIPKKHVEEYSKLLPEDHLAIAHLNVIGTELLSRDLDVHAIYYLLRDGSGTDKTVRHLHSQIMPYWKRLIDWHPQENLMAPIEVAARLRETLKTLKG